MAYKKLKLWFDEELAGMLSEKISEVKSNFDRHAFVTMVKNGVGPLELKDRVELIADGLHQFLGSDYKSNYNILAQILGPENEEETGMFFNYYWIMPIAKYVEKYGLNDFEFSMKAIEEITKRNTGEYAIRPFIEKYPNETLAVMYNWSKSENKHVRRLACEGGRPRLPWATKLQRFIDDPKPIIPILEQLKNDTSKYVQNSVANTLNDILKDNFEIARAIIEQWKINPTKERKWIINHAIRNYRKQKTQWALELVEHLNKSN